VGRGLLLLTLDTFLYTQAWVWGLPNVRMKDFVKKGVRKIGEQDSGGGRERGILSKKKKVGVLWQEMIAYGGKKELASQAVKVQRGEGRKRWREEEPNLRKRREKK